jgi:hypothetical protein
MTRHINTKLTPSVIQERPRTAREHRYMMPVVREVPRPVGPEALDRSIW